MDIIAGASRARYLEQFDPLKRNKVIVLSRSGAPYQTVGHMIENYIFTHPLPKDQKSYVCIIAGLCDLTEKKEGGHRTYQEIIYTKTPEATQDQIRTKISNLNNKVISLGAMPVFCTITPSHLKTWNLHRRDIGATSHLLYEHKYDQMQVDLHKAVHLANDIVIERNEHNHVHTPHLHCHFEHRKSKGKKYFQYKNMTDGCHPNMTIKEGWALSLGVTIEKNRNS